MVVCCVLCCVYVAYGMFAALGRIGAITGNFVFGFFLDSNPAIPFLVVTASLLSGGAATLWLPQPSLPVEYASVGHV
jgi:hypothetical protein